MTCIVGLVADGRVLMGGDSAGVSGYSLQHRADPKVFRTGECLLGYTSSFRMGQLLRYQFKPPLHDPDKTAHEYLATAFIDAVRACLKAGGWAQRDKEQEEGGSFLVAYRGGLYQVEGDYQVAELLDPYAAVGCGADLALGALAATEDLHLVPLARIERALAAAERHSAGVRAPFTVLELP